MYTNRYRFLSLDVILLSGRESRAEKWSADESTGQHAGDKTEAGSFFSGEITSPRSCLNFLPRSFLDYPNSFPATGVYKRARKETLATEEIKKGSERRRRAV